MFGRWFGRLGAEGDDPDAAGARQLKWVGAAAGSVPWVWWFVCCGLVFGLGLAAVGLAPVGSDVAAWWPAAGVSVTAVVVFYPRRWLFAIGIFGSSIAANAVGGRPGWVAVGFGLANAGESLVVGWCLHRWIGDGQLRRLRDMAALATGTVLGAMLAAILATSTLMLFAGVGLGRTVVNVTASHTAAVLLVLPLALSMGSVARRSVFEIAASWALSASIVLVAFAPDQNLPLLFLTMVPMVWTGFRLGVRAAALQLIAIGVAVTVLTARGAGPIALNASSASASNSLIQLFLISSALVVLPSAVAMAERERALHRVQTSEELFRRGFSQALVGMLLVEIRGTYLWIREANAAAQSEFDLVPGDVLGTELRGDQNETLACIADDGEPGTGWRGDMTYRRDGQDPRRYSVAVSRLSGDSAGLATCQFVDVTDRYLAERALEQVAWFDHLTGLPNRVRLYEQLGVELAAANASGVPVLVVFIDLDNFKLVNDTAGHQVGDAVLIEFARRLRSYVRPGDIVARMGGDEFVLLYPGIATEADARAVTNRILACADQSVRLADFSYQLDFSIGAAMSAPEAGIDDVLRCADLALYAAKDAGKRQVTFYTDDLGIAADGQLQLQSELHVALERRQFELFMQPVVELDTGRIIAAEALLRWRHPTRGVLAPAAFLDVVEKSGQMPEVGAWVLDEACRQTANWIRVVGSDAAPDIHANVSTKQLAGVGYARSVLDVLDRHQVPPNKLILEVTETYLAEVTPELLAEFHTLGRHGVRLAADDYGTGYSPLTRIIEMPIDMIKIDHQFVRAMTTDPRAHAIVASLTQLAHTLSLEVVAEGVETIDHADLLRNMGVAMAQGYLWNPALPPQDFQNLLVLGAEAQAAPD